MKINNIYLQKYKGLFNPLVIASIVIIAYLVSKNQIFVQKINLIKNPNIPTLTIIQSITPTPTPVEKEEANKIFQESGNKCPNNIEIYDWMKAIINKNSISSKEDSGKLKDNNKLYWACFILFEEMYNKSYQDRTSSQSISTSPPPTLQTTQIPVSSIIQKSSTDSVIKRRLFELQDRVNIWSDLINKYSSNLNNYQQQLVYLEKELIVLQNKSAEIDKKCAITLTPVPPGGVVEFPIMGECFYREDKGYILMKQNEINIAKNGIADYTNWLNDANLQYNRAKSEYESLSK